MQLKILIVFFLAAAVFAAPFCAIGEADIATTASDHSPGFINVLSFLGFVPASLTGQLKATFCTRSSLTSDDNSLVKRTDSLTANNGATSIAIVSILLEVLVVTFAIFGVVYSCVLWRRKRRELRENAERERVAQLPNQHPQPVDIELVAMNGGPVPHWPLTGNAGVATPPNTPEHQDAAGSSTQPGISTGPGAHPQAGNADGAAIPEIYVTDTDIMQPEPSNSEHDIVASRTHVEGSRLELGIDHPTYYSAFYHPETEATGNNTAESSDQEGRFLTPTTSSKSPN
ncbi:hypothetical protein F4803DRAFT_552313 [Xylaria telfairii]|nr:hypothetical protein F4803DRAFT_552313 [Xylaria telfairii]